MKIKDRKLDHLRICMENQVEAGDAGFDWISLKHDALPELDYEEIDLSTKFLGKRLDAPIMIEAMTGGVKQAAKINKEIASLAQEFGLGFSVGSQRAALEDKSLAKTFNVRETAPDLFLIGNLGAVQLNYGYGLRECRKAVDMIKADALALHLNALQEVMQPEGNTNFSGLIEKINDVAKDLATPVIVKETGCGISYETAKKLKVSAIDVAGAGGTSWSLVESYRMQGERKALGKSFASWGIPTADCVKEVSKLDVPVIASGGIRSGIDAAKAIALGADCVGVALPVLRAWATGGKTGTKKFLTNFISELRISMFLTGSSNVSELKGKIRGQR